MAAPDPRPDGRPRAVVVVPTYDEVENLERVVGHLLDVVPDVDVLVVDDASPDGTGQLADRMAGDDPRISVLHRRGRAGLGQAYLAGFQRALAEGYDTVVEMDADGSHPAEALPAMLDALALHGPDAPDDTRAGHRVDLVIGSRWVAGGRVENWAKRREILSRAANLYARILLRIHVRDSTGGYRAYRASALRELDLQSVTSRGYCFQIDMTLHMIETGHRVEEVPITFTDRIAGASKMGAGIVVEAMARVTWWGLTRRARRPAST